MTKEDSTFESVPEISESMLRAQSEADALADRLESQVSEEDVALPSVPKLLQLPQEALVKKTQELKAKDQQLDLLLLKAESYSHFIAENQKMSRLRNSVLSGGKETGKRKSAGSESSHAASKRVKDEGGAVDRDDSGGSCFVQPDNLVGGTLLPYQLEGLQWLLSLWENGISGILADEMGLGKTIQVISLIAQLRKNNTTGPFLIAGPLATVPNWVNEFKKWLPSCPVVLYHGSKAEREQLRRKLMKVGSQKDMTFPVVITSFEICMIDRPFLEKYTWQYLILDEGHRIKNRNCRLVQELKSIKSISRLLLTGTPIQNTLEELWSLLNFCSPAIFDDLRVFQAWFGFKNIGQDTQVDEIIGDEQQERIVSKLHEILRPFLLRRMKKDVLLKMPPKQEIVVYCGMSSLQAEYYTHVQRNTIRETLMGMGVEGAKDVSQINMLMNLRKVCNHPFLFGEPRDESGRFLGEVDPRFIALASGKFKLLDRMLPLFKARGHKVLIFSQMTELLSILEDYLHSQGMEYCRLDGSTKMVDRQRGIDKFNSDPNVFAYLLSTRAGGLGINLTAADTCIIFDSDWNPHQDSQAQDRCHRIGQSKPVVVYRLLTAGSVEIGMLEKQISKKKLERLTIHGGDYRKAGQRMGSALSLSTLRRLLEDDVKNLSRMTSQETVQKELATDSPAGGSADVVDLTEDQSDVEKDAGHRSHYTDISEEELDMITDRQRLFAIFHPSVASSVKDVSCEEDVVFADIPLEGQMYDIVRVEPSAGVLQSLS